MERTTTKVRTPDKAGDVGSCSCGGYPEAGLPEVKSRARGFRVQVQVQGVVRARITLPATKDLSVSYNRLKIGEKSSDR